MNYYQKSEGPVAHYPTKYDDCTLKATGRPYRFQKGSGRSEILNQWGADGRSLGEITKLAAEAGYDPNFTIGAIFRQHDTKDGAWRIEPPPGKTLEEIKGARAGREPSPEQLEKRRQKEAEREAKKLEREAKKQEREAARAEAEAERQRRAEAKAAEKAAAEREKAEAAAAGGGDGGEPAPVKGKGKARVKAPTPGAEVAETAPAA